MDSKRLYFLITAVLLGLVALAHLLRVVYGLEVRVGQGSFPLWLSAAGFVGAGFLSAWGFLLGCRRP
ncbi:MAG: hypothetical protein ACOYXN_03740 [Acidobacteriota bacterium]